MWCSRTIIRFLLTGLTTGFQVLLALYIPLYNQIPTKSEKLKIKEKKKKNKNKIFFFFFFHLDTERFLCPFFTLLFCSVFLPLFFFLIIFRTWKLRSDTPSSAFSFPRTDPCYCDIYSSGCMCHNLVYFLCWLQYRDLVTFHSLNQFPSFKGVGPSSNTNNPLYYTDLIW